MSINSYLESFSLPELFRLIEIGSKSGRLIVKTPISAHKKANLKRIYYIWFEKGYLVAVSDCLNHKGLINLISDRGWLSPPIVARLRTLCPPEVPLGTYLEKMKLLSPEKLSLIFQLQLHQVYQLFALKGGQFRFDELAEFQDRLLTIPWLEKTGHKMKTTEVAMYGLRLIKNWEIFDEQLPEADFALQRTVEQPHLKLLALERQIWELADSSMSLQQIAQHTLQPVKVIQYAAFRLIVLGLIDEVLLSRYDQEPFNAASQGIVRPNIDRTHSKTTNSQLWKRPLVNKFRQFFQSKFGNM